MTKFWTVVTALLIIGIGFLAMERLGEQQVNFSDLETECRYDRVSSTDIGVENSQITFSGNFEADSPEANLDYRYSISNSNNIELNIITRNSIVTDSFYNSCLASVVYEAETEKLESGIYSVKVYHNGEKQERVKIRIK